MVRYALLGATGGTGRVILRYLLTSPPNDLHLNVYVRNKSKLEDQFPSIEEKSWACAITIFEGSNTDRDLLQQCLEDVDAIFMCIATNYSKPGLTLFQDTALAVTDALSALKRENPAAYKTPSLVMMRALTLNLAFNPPPHRWNLSVLRFCLEHVYADMENANSIYETSGLVEVIYVNPPGMHDSEGTKATGYSLHLEPQAGVTDRREISYADLGISFCEIAERREEFAGKGVVPLATGEMRTTWPALIRHVLGGLRGRILGYYLESLIA